MNIAIYGYGNLGRGVEISVSNTEDMTLVGVFTRRNPDSIKTLTGAPVYNVSELPDFKDKIDVIIICGGSATDLPKMTPLLAEDFNVVDSFDTHAKIPEHFLAVDNVSRKNNTVSLISSGWDPGLFSLARVYSEAVLPNGDSYTFWGRGISQGHSDAIRRIPGVIDARQYTVPRENAIGAVRDGERVELTTREKHTRECYVVADENYDKVEIEEKIKTMPNYFADYDTTVTFITLEELYEKHSGMPHGGSVIRSGNSGLNNENKHTIEFSLKLDSNPEFTAGVLVAYARAVYRMAKRGEFGCKTVFDVAPKDLSILTDEQLRMSLL